MPSLVGEIKNSNPFCSPVGEDNLHTMTSNATSLYSRSNNSNATSRINRPRGGNNKNSPNNNGNTQRVSNNNSPKNPKKNSSNTQRVSNNNSPKNPKKNSSNTQRVSNNNSPKNPKKNSSRLSNNNSLAESLSSSESTPPFISDDMMELSGTVKSYSLAQGYGFIENVDDIVDGQDVRFNRKDLPGQLTNTQNLQGVSLHFQVKQNRDGKYSAFNIQDPASLPTFSSTLKSWNSQKGFGFIECPPELEELVETEGSGKRDIFLPGKFIVPESHRRHADLAGMAVRFSVEKSNQGLSANFARFVDLPLNEVGSNVPVGQAGKRKTDEGQNDPKKRRKLMGQIPPGRHNGRVSSFVQGKYGFINCDILDQELFFPAGDTNREWQAGEPCSFEIGTDGKTGKLRANGISPQLVPSQRAVAGFASAGTAITGNLERAKQAISACNVAELSELNLFLAQQISFRAMRR